MPVHAKVGEKKRALNVTAATGTSFANARAKTAATDTTSFKRQIVLYGHATLL